MMGTSFQMRLDFVQMYSEQDQTISNLGNTDFAGHNRPYARELMHEIRAPVGA
jgi:hypothetical protein